MVGAPHFFERKAEIGGAAYVYINPAGHWDAATPLRLTGTHGSMFGIALGTAGDLNLDGFEGEGLRERGGALVSHFVLLCLPLTASALPDLAVGAPFDGDGKVYIYHGSKLGIVVKPAQVSGMGLGGGRGVVVSPLFPVSRLFSSPGAGWGRCGGEDFWVRTLWGGGCGWEPLPRPARRLLV